MQAEHRFALRAAPDFDFPPRYDPNPGTQGFSYRFFGCEPCSQGSHILTDFG